MNKLFVVMMVALVMVAGIAEARPEQRSHQSVQRNYHQNNYRQNQYQNQCYNRSPVYVTPAPSAYAVQGILPQQPRTEVVFVERVVQQTRTIYVTKQIVTPEGQVLTYQVPQTVVENVVVREPVVVQQPPVVVVQQQMEITPEVMVLSIINSVIQAQGHHGGGHRR